MVYKCIVPNCRGNYKKDGIKVSIFGFPKEEELRRKWISAVPRDFEVTKNSRICELHFTQDDIRLSVEYLDEKSGKKTIVPLQQPRLNKNAVPSIFPGCPSYLSSNKISREEPETKKKRIECSQLEIVIEESLKSFQDYNEKFKIYSLDELREKRNLIQIPNGFNQSIKKQSEAVIGSEPDSVLGLEPKILSVAPAAELDSTMLITPDIDPPDLSAPGPSNRMEPDSSMSEKDVHLAMTCEVYPADAAPPTEFVTKVKEEPIDPDTYKQDILSATVVQELNSVTKDSSVTSSQVGSLFQPPVLIKEEPVSSEDEL